MIKYSSMSGAKDSQIFETQYNPTDNEGVFAEQNNNSISPVESTNNATLNLDERLSKLTDAVAKMEQTHTQEHSKGTSQSEVAGTTTDMVHVGRPGSDEEQIEINTPKFSRQHILHLLILFGMLFVGFTFIFQVYLTPISVVGISMLPTLNQSSTGATDYTHTDIIYCMPASHYKYGDIIITDTKAYNGQTDSVIKRVIATQGQTITFKLKGNVLYSPNLSNSHNFDSYNFSYTIWIDGEQLQENYIYSQDVSLNFDIERDYISEGYGHYQQLCESIRTTGEYSLTIPEGQVFLMGDNRNRSTDSRWFGTIETKHIAGKVVIHIPYGTNFFIGLWKSITGKYKPSEIAA